MDSLSSFEGGDLTGVSVTSDGTVRAGWTLGAAPIVDASSVWSSVVSKAGAVIIGTGAEGTIYQVAGGKVSVAADTESMAVSALAEAFGSDIIAGTFPDGKLFRIKDGKFDGKELKKEWIKLDDAEDVWDLAYDAKNKALYAATGPSGKLFRITDQGKADVYFDSDESHLVSVAVGPDGAVYAGSNGKGLLYKISGPGRAEVVRDFGRTDVKDIVFDSAGSMYVIANNYSGGGGLPRYSSSRFGRSSSPSGSAGGGQGLLMRFSPGGVAESMFTRSDTYFQTLALDDQGKPHVGTGKDGKVYSVDDNHVEQLLADTKERQVGAMMLVGPKRYIATGDPVVYHEITGVGGADAVWTSQVFDAGLRAHFGLLDWRANGKLEFQTRTGNTEKPDDSWTQWSAPLGAPAKITSPSAQYFQLRARWNRDAKAVLEEVTVSFVTDNARALITSISAGSSKSSSSGSSVPNSGGPVGAPSTTVSLSWNVDNPDNDTLRYRLFYRPVKNGKKWISLLDADEKHTSTSYSWDTSGIPEGEYQVKVEATDELSNPPGKVTSHSLTSRAILVDNTPPQITKLSMSGTKLQGTAEDKASPIARIEFALVGSKTFYPIYPTDNVFDEKIEPFEVDTNGLIPPGVHYIVVKAYDSAGNSDTKSIKTGS